MKIKTVLLDEIAMNRALKRIAHEIIEKNKGVGNLVLLGVAKGGIPVCQRLAQFIFEIESVKVPTFNLDVTSYRDDLVDEGFNNSVKEKVEFSLQDKDVILCDDVLFTGRTVRAGIEAIIKRGRPRTIQLAVLIDRGHRELPIRADYVGKNVPTSREEVVSVFFEKDIKAVILNN